MQVLLTALLLCLWCFPAMASEWPMIRGTNFDGHSEETGLIESWPEAGPPVLWTRELGQGYSAFTGRGDHVYTQYQTLAGQYVICLNARTGETIWEYRYNLPFQPAGLYPGPRSTPTLAGDRLYFTTPQGELTCLNASTGKKIWHMNLFEKFQAEMVEFGYSCSPLVIDEKVIMPVGGKGSSLVALRASDGELIWQSGDQPVSHVPAFPIERNGRKLVVAYLKNSLCLFDRETGEQLIHHNLSSGYDEHAAWPIYEEPYLWIAGPFRAGARLLELTDTDPPEFKQVWMSQLMSNDVCSSVLVNGYLYGFDLKDVQSKIHRPSRGTFRCLEFATGQEMWSNGTPNERREINIDAPAKLTDSIGHASVISADGKLILFNDIGELLLVNATPDAYEPLARIQILGGSIVWTSPTLIDKRLYLRNQKRAVCLYLGKPETLETPATSMLSVADIPQEQYRDWAAMLLPVEPEYAMDAPTLSQLHLWFWISLGLGWGVAPLLVLPLLVLPGLIPNRWRTWAHFQRNSRIAAFLLGLLGTTYLSGWQQEFLFTWPLSLAILMEIVVWQLEPPKNSLLDSSENQTSHPWRARLLLLFLAGFSLLYFLVCRRLSLAFEWTFLIGYLAAMPVLLLARRVSFRSGKWYRGLEFSLSALAFVAFYWCGAIVILVKYG